MRPPARIPRVRITRFTPLLFFFTVCVFIFYTLSARKSAGLSSTASHAIIPFTDPIPLITLIIVYTGENLPVFSSYFFDSVERQGHGVELLVIQRKGCSNLRQLTRGVGNIKHVCLSEKQFWGAHRDAFCKRWGGCTRAESKIMLGDMMTYGRLETPQSVYPTLRGWVFKKYMNRRTAYWGFCDMDIFLGDLSQNFPYDLAAQNDYDVFSVTEPSENGGNRLLFMRGHMTFFRNSQVTEDRLLGYEYYRSFQAWDEMPRPSPSVGEGDLSHFVMGDPRINVLAFDGLAPAPLVRTSSIAGVISLPHSLRPAAGKPPTLPKNIIRQLNTPALHLPTRPSFTYDGLEFPMTVTQGSAPPNYGLWFPEKFCTWYVAQPQPKKKKGVDGRTSPDRWRRYVMKLDNEWTERLEPMHEFKGHDVGENGEGGMDGAYQWLYAHWQEEKKMAHFRELPAHLDLTDIFVSYFYDGNAAFNAITGERSFWLPKREEDCEFRGCIAPGETPISERETFLRFRSTRLGLATWYEESKRLRLGFATGTLGPDPSKPTNM
ncbi:hypothetical protein IAT38_003747 [Cryptococcus sp. DSM 104549]